MPALPPTPPALTRVEAAVAVVRAYYRAVDGHDYARAYRLWTGGRSYAEFVRGYRHTAHVAIRFVPPFDVEGGAGSSYATIPVILDATLDTGRHQHFRGDYTLRRVNDVDGATARQRRWHIAAARLAATD